MMCNVMIKCSMSLRDSFSNTDCCIMNSINALNPNSDVFLKETALFSFVRLYDSNTEDLRHELFQFTRILGKYRPGCRDSLVLQC